MRASRSSVIAAGLVTMVACKQPAPSSGEQVGRGSDSAKPMTGSGSAAGSGTAAGAGSGSSSSIGRGSAAVPAAPKPVPVDPAALDKALTHKHVAAKAVIRRASGPSSQWALIARYDKNHAIRGYDLLRVRADDATTLRLIPHNGGDARFEPHSDSASIEVRDLDNDGNDDALVVADWGRSPQVSDPCEGCFRYQNETASQLYVVSGDSRELKLAFTHLVKYASYSEGVPEGNTTPTADPDNIEYDWKVLGAPPVLKLTRSKAEIATAHRLRGAVDPASDPLLSAGAGKDVTLVLP